MSYRRNPALREAIPGALRREDGKKKKLFVISVLVGLPSKTRLLIVNHGMKLSLLRLSTFVNYKDEALNTLHCAWFWELFAESKMNTSASSVSMRIQCWFLCIFFDPLFIMCVTVLKLKVDVENIQREPQYYVQHCCAIGGRHR